MKIRNAFKLLLAVVGLSIVFSSCESLKKMAKNHPTLAKYEATPNPVESHGDKITVNIKGSYQPKYFNSNAVVVLQPSIVYEGGSKEMKPIILKGDKVVGEGTVISKAKGGSFSYTDVVEYTPEMNKSEIIFNPVAYTAKKAKDLKITNAKEAIAVPKALELGETKVADGTVATANRFEKEGSKLTTATDKYEKETIIAEKATIYYVVDMSNLNWSAPFNKMDANKQAIKNLEESFANGLKIKRININSWASPEGEESRNQNLSDDRSKTAEKYIKGVYDKSMNAQAKKLKVKPQTLKQDLVFNAQSLGEDWDGFLADLRASDIAEKNTIINVISSHTDRASREQEIRNMTVIYKQIEDQILPSLRRSEMVVEFLENKKTDEQIAEYSLTKPDSLLLEELLYAATLTEDTDNKLKIYISATQIYPEDVRGYMNASALYIEQKNYDQAEKMLQTANGVVPNNAGIINNMGVVFLAKGDLKNAKSSFESAVASGNQEAQFNLAPIYIKEGKYSEALGVLGTTPSYNLALAQLMSNKLTDAKATLAGLEKTAQVYYLTAVVAAREKANADVIANLRKAIEQNKSLKEDAKSDAEFILLVGTPEFMELVK